jgi:hypothetical protein
MKEQMIKGRGRPRAIWEKWPPYQIETRSTIMKWTCCLNSSFLLNSFCDIVSWNGVRGTTEWFTKVFEKISTLIWWEKTEIGIEIYKLFKHLWKSQCLCPNQISKISEMICMPYGIWDVYMGCHLLKKFFKVFFHPGSGLPPPDNYVV